MAFPNGSNPDLNTLQGNAEAQCISWHSLENLALIVCLMLTCSSAITHGQGGSAKPPNILVIMGDDVGWFNIAAYHRGMMASKMPNLDKLAAGG
jgi:hypothetical protein